MKMIYYKIILLACTISLVFCKTDDKCLDIPCFCEDYGPMLYQCPKGRKTEIEIQVERNNQIKMYCLNKPTHILPKYVFNPDHLTIENCSISNRTVNIFNTRNVETLDIDQSMLGKDFVDLIYRGYFPLLNRLILNDIELENSTLPPTIAPNLNYLELRRLNLPLTKKVIGSITQIKVLNMKKIKLTSVDAEIFQNLSNLLELEIDSNSIEELHNDAFKSLKKLTTLNLADNEIKFISRQVLEPLKSMSHIILDLNQGIKLDDHLFSNFSQLSIVHLRTLGLYSVPEDIFSGSTNISEISLESNEISSIPQLLFKGLHNLKYVYLNDNKIKTLNGIFENLVNMRILDLNDNEISSIEANDFRGLVKLNELSLSHNKIERINESAFETNVLLENLQLPYNIYPYEVVQGKYYTESPFSKCKNLKYLDLSYNLMKDILNDVPVLLNSLKSLNLEGNKIESLDLENIRRWNEAFEDISINVKNNNISFFSRKQMMDPDYSLDAAPIGPNKIRLAISGNPISCDCHALELSEFIKMEARMFLDLAELKCASPPSMDERNFFDIDDSEFVCDLRSDVEQCGASEDCSCFWRPFDKTFIVNCSSSNMTEVPTLNISLDLAYEKIEVHLEDNLLSEFPFLEGYENVTSLFLARNNIRNVSWIPKKIEVIDISHNNLTSLAETVVKSLSSKSVRNITMAGNFWTCDCDSYYIKDFLVGNIKKIDAENVKCAASGLTMYSVTKEDICSEGNVFIVLKATLFIFPIIIILILAIFYYKYEQQIKIWLYARNLCLSILAEEDLDKHKEYDVFLSYSHKDAEFVENRLVPILEDTPFQYKLCVHYRDWTPGTFISENIANSVASSKRTLIVLTPNFLESVWGKMEFRTAHAEALKEKRNRVILMLKEDIDTERLDPELKSYISTNTYLEWGDPWFWKKLRYALPRKQHQEEIRA